ncbi:hypothetical protein [Psychrobacter immobilis]|uniref:hypothetical protein n=1 Tax=Psychrobacter immobilis TaxID=498 RepID=UPI00191923BB|nr:hypothetical protein [Psychrobacter immobilis]
MSDGFFVNKTLRKRYGTAAISFLPPLSAQAQQARLIAAVRDVSILLFTDYSRMQIISIQGSRAQIVQLVHQAGVTM